MQIGVELRFEVNPFKRQPHKMVKHTQIIRRQQPTNCFSDHFVGLELKGLKDFFITCSIYQLSMWLSRSCVIECQLIAVMVMIGKPSIGQQPATKKATLTSCWRKGRTSICKIVVVGRPFTWLHTIIMTLWKHCCTIVQIDPS